MKKKIAPITLDKLAGMMQNSFGELTNTINGRFEVVDKRLDRLDQGQEEIKLKLDNVAYRFELVELQRRVALLERKNRVR